MRRLLDFYRARYGPARGFRLRDPFDHSSNQGDGEPGMTDEPIGLGDGVTADFQLVRTYGDQQRPITRPEPGSILVSLDGEAASGWTHMGKGKIRFDEAPATGMEIRAGFRFDVPVRFAEDRLDVSGATSAAGEAPVGLESTGDPAFCTIWTLCGVPALNLPILQGPNGMPIGIQMISFRGDDARLFRTARWLLTLLEDI